MPTHGEHHPAGVCRVLDGEDRHAAAFELRVDDGMTLHIPAGFDEGELRRLIRALRC